MHRFALTAVGCLTALAGLTGVARAEVISGPVYCTPKMQGDGSVSVECSNDDQGGGYDTGGENGAPPLGRGWAIPNVGWNAIYRLVSAPTADHLLTASHDEAVAANNSFGYGYEGIIGRFLAWGAAGASPLYRGWSQAANDHFYSASWSEIHNAAGYVVEGVAGYVYTWWHSGTCALYRTRIGSHHFFTTSWTEASEVINRGGGVYEGVAGYLLPYGSSCPN